MQDVGASCAGVIRGRGFNRVNNGNLIKQKCMISPLSLLDKDLNTDVSLDDMSVDKTV